MERPPGGDPPKVDVRQQLAADRTLLAWLRTSIALAGLGFVVARFHLLVRAAPATGTWAHARIVGVALVVVSVLVAGLGLLQHHQVTRMLGSHGDNLPVSRAPAVAATAVTLLVLVALCVYLIAGVS